MQRSLARAENVTHCATAWSSSIERKIAYDRENDAHYFDYPEPVGCAGGPRARTVFATQHRRVRGHEPRNPRPARPDGADPRADDARAGDGRRVGRLPARAPSATTRSSRARVSCWRDAPRTVSTRGGRTSGRRRFSRFLKDAEAGRPTAGILRTIMLLHRSLLFVPGARADMLEKAGRFDADMLCLDLEESVLPEDKAQARELVRPRSAGCAEAGRTVHVRINPIESGAYARRPGGHRAGRASPACCSRRRSRRRTFATWTCCYASKSSRTRSSPARSISSSRSSRRGRSSAARKSVALHRARSR